MEVPTEKFPRNRTTAANTITTHIIVPRCKYHNPNYKRYSPRCKYHSPRHTLSKEIECIAGHILPEIPRSMLATQTISSKKVYRWRKYCHCTLSLHTTQGISAKRVYRKRKTLPLPPFSARETDYFSKKGVSRTKWHVFPRFPARDTGFFRQKSVSQTEHTYPEPKFRHDTWKLAIKGVSRIGTVPWLLKDWQSRNTLNPYIIES